MKNFIKATSVTISVLLILCTLCVCAFASTPSMGYELVSKKVGDNIVAEIYVKGGVAMTGKVALTFDPSKVTLINHDGTDITEFKLNQVVKSAIGNASVSSVIENTQSSYSDNSIIITSETNYNESVLRGNDYLYFAWFANYSSFVYANAAPVKVAEVKFKLAPNATGYETAVTLRPEAPSADSGIVGYKTGLYIGEYLNGKNVSHYSTPTNPTLTYTSRFADTGFVVNDGALVEYTGSDTVVAIPGDVTTIQSGVFGSTTTEVKIPSTVTEIQTGAFASGTTVYVSPRFSVESIASLKAEGNTVVLYGDVNGDGVVNATDLTLYIKSLGGADVEITENLIVTDVNNDGIKSLKDLSRFIKFLAGLPNVDLGYQG